MTLELIDGPFDCDIKMKKSASKCYVGPFAKVNYLHANLSLCCFRSLTGSFGEARLWLKHRSPEIIIHVVHNT